MATTETAERERGVTVDQEALNGARDRLREESNGQRAMDTPRQLSFIASNEDEQPDFASVKIGGSMPVKRDLYTGQGFLVRVCTLRGEVICEREVAVTNVAFPRKVVNEIPMTERVHTLTLE